MMDRIAHWREAAGMRRWGSAYYTSEQENLLSGHEMAVNAEVQQNETSLEITDFFVDPRANVCPTIPVTDP